MDVIDQQTRSADTFPKAHELIVLDAVNVLVGELFRRDVATRAPFFMRRHEVAEACSK